MIDLNKIGGDLLLSGLERKKSEGGNGMGGDFSETLLKSLGGVNELELKGSRMVEVMVADPGKMNVHELSYALSEAELALSVTKAVTERVINAYREMVNLR